MTPKQLRQYIDETRTENLYLKHEIEACEFELEQNNCESCQARLLEELEIMQAMVANTKGLSEALNNLEEYLAEDEIMNGWKGEDRIIEI